MLTCLLMGLICNEGLGLGGGGATLPSTYQNVSIKVLDMGLFLASSE